MCKRLLCFILCCVLCLTAAMPAAADTTFWLLPAEEADMSSVAGEASIIEKGALHLTAATAEGASVAVEVNETIHVDTVRYLQLSLRSTAPFNIALKMSGAQYDLFPQTAGPSWYEAFQDTAPGEGEGVKAGEYTVSLDIAHYIKYNGIQLSQNGYATIKTVHIALRGAGEMTVDHLAVSDMGSFRSPNGLFGMTATTKAPITTAAPNKETTAATVEGQTTDPTATVPTTVPTVAGETQPTATYGSIATPQSLRDRERGEVSRYTWLFLIGGIGLVVSAVLPFMSKRFQKSRKKK
ncbi:MAG: hypothetical protein IJC52_00250 [Clostridia bacterium]|nr:hypothetical protein [Clostridia bacterium]